MIRLKFLLIMAFLVGLVSLGYAQETITPEDAAKFIGQQKRYVARLRAPILQPSQRDSLLSLISTNHIQIRFSQCSSGDRAGASSKSRPRYCIRAKRFV
jgi:hypothetical protein